MNKTDAAKVLYLLKIAYPNTYKGMTDHDSEQTIAVWTTMFQNDNPELVIEAVQALIYTLKYPPTIADVKEKINLITKQSEMTEMEAWNLVSKAIQNSAYHAEEEFNNLPDLIKRLVGSPNQLREWSQMESDVFHSVIQSNFMRSYKARVQQQKELDTLPESAKELQKRISENIMSKIIREIE